MQCSVQLNVSGIPKWSLNLPWYGGIADDMDDHDDYIMDFLCNSYVDGIPEWWYDDGSVNEMMGATLLPFPSSFLFPEYSIYVFTDIRYWISYPYLYAYG